MPGVTFNLAVPISHMAAGGGAMRFERISEERRAQFVRAQHEMRQGEFDRRNSDIRAGAQARASGGQPVRMAGGAAVPGRAMGAGAPAYGRAAAPSGYAARPGTAAARKPETSKKSRDPRDKEQGNR
jgi:hypothetical protein